MHMTQIAGLALSGLFALAAPSDGAVDRERVEWIELDADSTKGAEPGGRLLASPEFMKRSSRIYHFGGRTCGGGLSKRVMDALLDAMRNKTLVGFQTHTVSRGEQNFQCIDSVRLFSPD